MTVLVMALVTISVLGAMCLFLLLRLRRYEAALAAQDEEAHRLRRELRQEQRRRRQAETISGWHAEQLMEANSGLVMQYRNWKRKAA